MKASQFGVIVLVLSGLVSFAATAADIEAGKTSLADLETYALSNEEPMVASGRQEVIESIINDCI